MNVFPRLVVLISFLGCFAMVGFGQHQTLEYSISFLSKKNSGKEIVSKKQKLYLPDSTTFVRLSAFVLDPQCTAELAFRIKTKSGWTPWELFHKNDHDRTPDRIVYDGELINDRFVAIQFKSNKSIAKEVRFRLFVPQSFQVTKAASEKTFTDCVCPTPDICARDCWCPTCPEDNTPNYTTPTHIVIHHSATTNSSDDFAGVVASFYDYHVNTNGWDDIGYNFLIDPNGVIYEGRGNGVQGAHFSCMNTHTVGICVIGDFQTVAPQPAAIQHLLDFLAWEACLYDIDISDYSYLPLADMDLMNVCAHRDGNDSESPNSCASGTECPGDVLYGLIPTFRDLLSYFPCLQETVVVEELELMDSIEIFPNPVKDTMHVKASFLSPNSLGVVSIYDMTGQRVYCKSKMIETQGQLTISDCRSLSPGTYLLHYTNREGNIKTKFIKE